MKSEDELKAAHEALHEVLFGELRNIWNTGTEETPDQRYRLSIHTRAAHDAICWMLGIDDHAAESFACELRDINRKLSLWQFGQMFGTREDPQTESRGESNAVAGARAVCRNPKASAEARESARNILRAYGNEEDRRAVE